MAVLANGVETLEFGDTDWVTAMNANFLIIDTTLVVAAASKSLVGHDHDTLFDIVATTINQAVLEPFLSAVTTDIKFTNDTEGISVIDTVALTAARIYVDNGVILSEVVV